MAKADPRNWLRWLVRDPAGKAKRLRRRVKVNPLRTRRAKRELDREADLGAADRALLQQMDSRVHPLDEMYVGTGLHYFAVALSAMRCIEQAVAAAGVDVPQTILDLPCGYGRVTRALVSAFPQAAITASDIQPRAVRFCERRWGADGALSSTAFDQVAFARRFDLIWCGSLVTHLDAPQTLALVDLFARSARSGAVVVLTTHGLFAAEQVRAGVDCLLSPAGAERATREYEASGYGYADYPWDDGYGFSLTSPEWIREHVEGRGGLSEVLFLPRGWGDYQDVFAFVKRG
jgi:2-polyprenyl-3-methyl-5-hydroxy-6-metoxy-1,4-benzoquinol methylase